MEIEKINRSDLQENIAVIKINQSYNDNLSALELYDITRGCWKRKLESVMEAEYVLAVAFGLVKEVYCVERWVPASELHRETIPYNAEKEKGRIGFFGTVAEEKIREKYIGKSVANLYKWGDQSTLKVFLKKDNIMIADIDSQILKFADYVRSMDNDPYEPIDFRNKELYLGREESYKEDVFNEANLALSVSNWKKSDIGTGKISKCVLSALSEAENLVNAKFVIPKFKDKLDSNNKDYISECEKILYDVYYMDDEGEAFENFINAFGRIYPLVAYIFFIKDKNRFLPVSPELFDASFKQINISFRMSYQCSWENYCEYISIIDFIRLKLNDSGIVCHDVSLLDAHSFVWILNHSEYINWDKVRQRDIKLAEQINDEISALHLKGGTRDALVKQRVGQGEFRKILLNRYKRCCLCNVCNIQFLRASHIKPWAKSDAAEKLDVDNGFLLCPNHDSLFDKGYISFDKDGKIIISDELEDVDRINMNIRENMVIKLTEKNKKYLEYHRRYEFERWKKGYDE